MHKTILILLALFISSCGPEDLTSINEGQQKQEINCDMSEVISMSMCMAICTNQACSQSDEETCTSTCTEFLEDL